MLRAAALAGMTEAEFWRTTPRFFMLRTYAQREAEKAQYRVSYEAIRYGAFLQISARMPKGKSLKLHDLGRFPWEKIQNKGAIFTTEEYAIRLANMEAALARIESEETPTA